MPRTKPSDLLDAFLDDAREGASDDWLCEQANVSVSHVRAWRKQRGLIPDKGETQRGLAALQTLGQYDPTTHHTAADLDFEVPQYVVRVALGYTGFAHAAWHLFREAMLSPAQIAAALGVRVADVDLALAAWKRHLSAHGTKCLGCATLIDSRFGNFCSRTCHEQHIPRPHAL